MTSQVDFYLLESSDGASRMNMVCRLAEKIQRMGHNILVLTVDGEQAKSLDALMWTFSQSSFVPHALADTSDEHQSDGPGSPNPVLIHHLMMKKTPEVVINLKSVVPQSADLQRVVEIVDQDEQVIASGREKYRNYQIQNFTIRTHNLPAKR